MYPKDFNEDEHLICPRCGFEVVWAEGKEAAYIFKNGEIDHETLTRDNEFAEVETIMCNSRKCYWEI